jgi:hypothetical protein
VVRASRGGRAVLALSTSLCIYRTAIDIKTRSSGRSNWAPHTHHGHTTCTTTIDSDTRIVELNCNIGLFFFSSSFVCLYLFIISTYDLNCLRGGEPICGGGEPICGGGIIVILHYSYFDFLRMAGRQVGSVQMKHCKQVFFFLDGERLICV